MNCQLFEAIINDLARASVMDAATRDGALAHAQACPLCAARLRDERVLTEGLRKVAASVEGTQAPPRIEATLLAAFRELHSPSLAPVVMRRRERRLMPWAIAAAATILIALTLVALRLDRSPATTRENAGAIKPEQPAPAPQTQDAAPPPVADKGEHKQITAHKHVALHKPRGGRAPSRTAGRKKDEGAVKPQASSPEVTEIATEFMPLVQGDNLSAMESGQIVRVELPRSALISFGLPMNMERANERIKADVVLGNDGMARAIRFVR